MSGPRAEVANAADPEQVATATRRAKSVREQELADLRAVLATRPGRRVLWRLMSACHVFEARPYLEGAALSHSEGERNVGLFMLAEIQSADPEALLTMMREASPAKET